jgi:hypothetical protein
MFIILIVGGVEKGVMATVVDQPITVRLVDGATEA